MSLTIFFFNFFVFSKSIVTIIDTIQFFPKDKTCLGFSRVNIMIIEVMYRAKLQPSFVNARPRASSAEFADWLAI